MDRTDAARVWLGGLAAWLLIAVTATLPLAFVPDIDDGYALPKALVLRGAGVAVSLAFVSFLAAGGRFTLRLDRWIDGAVAAFLALTLLSTLASVDTTQSVLGEPYQYQGAVTVSLYVGAFYLARVVLGTPDRFRSLVLTHVAVGALVAGYAIAQTLGVDPFWSGPPEDRAISSVGQANDLAAYLDLVIVAAVASWPRSGTRVRAATAFALVLSSIALGLTLSRGGFLALGVAVVLILAFAARTPRSMSAPMRRSVGLISLAIVAMFVISAPSIRSVAERIASTGDLAEGSVRMHLDSWRVGIAIAADRPLLGSGPETFPLVFADYLDGTIPPDRAAHLRRFRLESPHNEWIGIASESGIPAVIAYVVFLIRLAVDLARRAIGAGRDGGTIALAALSILVVHVVTNAFKTPDTTTSTLFWVTVGSGLAASRALGEPLQAGADAQGSGV